MCYMLCTCNNIITTLFALKSQNGSVFATLSKPFLPVILRFAHDLQDMVKVQEENGALRNEVQELKQTNSEQLKKMQVAHPGIWMKILQSIFRIFIHDVIIHNC